MFSFLKQRKRKQKHTYVHKILISNVLRHSRHVHKNNVS